MPTVPYHHFCHVNYFCNKPYQFFHIHHVIPYHQAQLQVTGSSIYALRQTHGQTDWEKRLTEMGVSTKNVLMHTFMMRTTKPKSTFGFL